MIPDAHAYSGLGLSSGNPPYPTIDGPEAISLMDHAAIDRLRIFTQLRINGEFTDPGFESDAYARCRRRKPKFS